jgi:hypothetical protein
MADGWLFGLWLILIYLKKETFSETLCGVVYENDKVVIGIRDKTYAKLSSKMCLIQQVCTDFFLKEEKKL